MSSESVPSTSWSRDLLWLTLGLGLLLGFRLGSYPLGNPDEGRYAEIPREMIASGDYVTPRLNGVNYFEKPPLMYWAVAGCERLFGHSEWSVRAMPALCGLAGALLTYAATRRLYGRNAGLAAAIVLGTSLLYFATSRILILDMAVSVLMTAALFCFILGVREAAGSQRRWLFYGLYASAALATLTKGMIGFLLPGAVMFLWLLLFDQWRHLRPFYLPTGGVLFLALALPWHVLATRHNETWAHRYFVYEHFERFTTPAAGRHGQLWYFVPVIFFGLFPWMGFLWPAVRSALRGGWVARRQNADAWFFVTWAVFIFLFFTKSHSKLVPYILPVFPPLAVLTGTWLAPQWSANLLQPLRGGLRLFSFVCGVLALAMCFVFFKEGIVRMDHAQAAVLRPHAYFMAAVLAGGGVIVLGLALLRNVRTAFVAMIVTMVVFFGALSYAAPHLYKPGTRSLALQVAALARPGDRVMHYHEFFHDFTFYAQRVVDVVSYKGELELEEDAAARASGRFLDEAEFRRLWTQPGRILVVARKVDLIDARTGRPKDLFADPAFRYHLLGESPDHYLLSNQP